MNTAIPQASLQLVSDELAVTLNDARVVLEQYAEGEGGAQALERAAALMHTARGVLRMTETHGASLLAEEMEHTCAHLSRIKRQEIGSEEPLEALMRAAAQLPAYVERVLNGGRDIPLVLLPLLNDLRAARGRPLLSESTLLLLNIGSDTKGKGRSPQVKRSGEDLTQLSQELRPRFQLALLGWIRGDTPEANLRKMLSVVERLEAAAGSDEVHQLWWVVAGIIEALLAQGLDTSVALKRLMGHVDRELKRLRTLGEEQFAKAPPTELVNNFLYYIARARQAGPRAAAIRAAFNLSDLVPGDAQVEQARQNLSAPSVKLMQTVAQALREDLSRVKDVLDIFVRTGMERIEELAPQLELLKKIGDTLGVLGLGELREIVQQRREQLQELVSQGRRPDEAALVGIAAGLLNVEDRLEGDLIGMIAPHADEPTVVSLDVPDRGADLSQVTPAVMRECLVNLARVKEAVSQVTERRGDAASLDALPEHLQGITAGLMMIGRERAAGVVETLHQAIRALVRAGQRTPDRVRLDRLADATVSLEYYLETLQAGRSDPNYMLDNAERCLAGLTAGLPTAAESALDAGSVLDYADTIATPTVSVRSLDTQSRVQPQTQPEATHVLPLVHPAGSQPAQVFSGGPERLDPDLLETFIEEAREEIANIGRSFPAWEKNDADGNALASLRRSFHTLKGSGRMVGADRIGEYAWASERLLNQLINGTVARSPEVLAVIARAIAALPALLEELETGRPPQVDIAVIVNELQQATGVGGAPVAVAPPKRVEPPTQYSPTVVLQALEPPKPAAVPPEYSPTVVIEAVDIPEPPRAPAEAPTGMDPVLLDILTREVNGHLAEVRRFIEHCDQSAPPYTVAEELHRAVHTLNGSIAMARVMIGLPLTEALNALVSFAWRRPARLPPTAIDTLRESAARIDAILRWLAEPTHGAPPTADLEQRVQEHLYALEHPETREDVDLEALPEGDVVFETADESMVVEELSLPTEELQEDFVLSEGALEAQLAGATGISVEEELASSAESADFEVALHSAFEPASDATEPDAELLDSREGAEAGEAEPDLASATASLPQPDFAATYVESTSAVEYDPEIAAIFAEEAAELLEASDRAVAGIAESADAQAMADLQRHLHTLKGGARMAGLSIMGDFSHDLETLLIGVNEGTLPHTPAVNELLQASLDELHRMRDNVLTGEPRPIPQQLGARLQAALRGQAAPTAAVTASPAPTVAVSAPAPVVAPVPPVAPIETRVEPAPIESQIEPPIDQYIELATPTEEPTAVDSEPESLPEIIDIEAVEIEISADLTPEIEAPAVEIELSALQAQLSAPEIELPAPEVELPFVTPVAASAASLPAEAVVDEVAPREIVLPATDRLGELARELEQPPIAASASMPESQRAAPERRETARVDSVLLDTLLNNAGEISIFQSRLTQQVTLIEFNLEELGATVMRLREQLRKLELETEAQILFRHQDDSVRRTDFDPLELDRYSTIQQLSRGLAESATDVNSLKDLLQNMARDTEALLIQQARTATELQDGLMRTRMVPFQQHAPRLARLVRQTAAEYGKRAELQMQGGGELDRQVLEHMLGPFEHMLRNAVIHGLETSSDRQAAGKPRSGNIFINLRREGSEAVVEIADDGRGLNVPAIRRKAVELGFVEPGAQVSDEEAMQFILRPGFSTAEKLTQAAGRGIGMDVVTSEVSKLGGSLRIHSVPGKGTTFSIRLPFTLAVTQALIVRAAHEIYALPLPTVEGVIRISRAELMARLGAPQPTIDYGNQTYHFRHLGEFLGLGPSRLAEEENRVSVILVRAGEHSTALITDEMHDSREIVVKPVGPQLATIRGVAGATILGDGRIAVILDMGILVRTARVGTPVRTVAPEVAAQGPLALVVDDSITMRRVTQRLLERNGFRVVTAKDGLDAIATLQDHHPDIILLDVEMPRMDGYEFAKHVRNNPDTAVVPIVMITSRVSDKHKARAIEVGVNDYLGKPYQERQLLEAVRHQLAGVA